VIDKGRDIQNFKSAFEQIYGWEPSDGLENIQNVVYLQSHFHNGPMDNQNLSDGLKIRRIAFDWINRCCYIQDFFTGEISKHNWIEGAVPNVKNEYFAWSNANCSRKLKKFLRKIQPHGRQLCDWSKTEDD
jgi:hypothetical protein